MAASRDASRLRRDPTQATQAFEDVRVIAKSRLSGGEVIGIKEVPRLRNCYVLHMTARVGATLAPKSRCRQGLPCEFATLVSNPGSRATRPRARCEAKVGEGLFGCDDCGIVDSWEWRKSSVAVASGGANSPKVAHI